MRTSQSLWVCRQARPVLFTEAELPSQVDFFEECRRFLLTCTSHLVNDLSMNYVRLSAVAARVFAWLLALV